MTWKYGRAVGGDEAAAVASKPIMLQFGESGSVSCLSFGMEPLLVETWSDGSDAGDAEGLACPHCLGAGLHLHLKVLLICRGQRRAADISYVVSKVVQIVTVWVV